MLDNSWIMPLDGIAYAATRCGRIFKLAGGELGPEIKQRLTSKGYLECWIRLEDGTKKRRKVHRLVAAAWLPKPSGDVEVCHLNGVRNDNRLENLKWDTRKGNYEDIKRYDPNRVWERKRKLTRDDAADIKAALAAGESGNSIAKRYGVSIFHVSNIKNGRVWVDA